MSSGAVVLAQGLSDVRPVFKVEITALMGSEAGAVAKAVFMSVGERGVPVVMERLGWAERASGRRTRAVTVWLRERASEMTREPVRPLAPRRRTRIVKDERGDGIIGGLGLSRYQGQRGLIVYAFWLPFVNLRQGGLSG